LRGSGVDGLRGGGCRSVLWWEREEREDVLVGDER
jgi:hypothetical protein